MSDGVSGVTPSQLTMLIKWARDERPEQGEAEQPGRGQAPTRFTNRELAAHTLVCALLALRDEGSVSLQYVERRQLVVFKSRHVMVEKVRPTAFADSTFEGELWATLGSWKTTPVAAHDLVFRWLLPKPTEVHRWMRDHLVTAGLLVAEEHDRHHGKSRGDSRRKPVTVFSLHPDAGMQALPAVHRHCALLAERKKAPDELSAKLLKEVRRVIDRHRYEIEEESGVDKLLESISDSNWIP